MSAGLWERLAGDLFGDANEKPTEQPGANRRDITTVAGHGFRTAEVAVPRRVVVYAAGDVHQVAQQQHDCAVHAAEAGLTIVGMATDAEIGQSVGWVSAMAMLAAGDVDGILVAGRVVIPGLILAAVPPAQRRTVPLRRASGGAR